MIEVIRARLEKAKNREEKYATLREYLQLLVLRIIDVKKYYQHIAFTGGTALRIIYGLNRFSEDLDFSLINKHKYNFSKLLTDIKYELVSYGFDVELTRKESGNVHSSFIKFRNILAQTGLASQNSQVLSIKLEIDTNPPSGYKTVYSPVNKGLFLIINNYDLPSMFACKLHAVLCRKYSKGRDFYDFIWFVAGRVVPDLQVLQNAWEQTEHQQIVFDLPLLKTLLRKRIENLDVAGIKRDIMPFLVDAAEIRFFEKEYMLDYVSKIGE